MINSERDKHEFLIQTSSDTSFHPPSSCLETIILFVNVFSQQPDSNWVFKYLSCDIIVSLLGGLT